MSVSDQVGMYIDKNAFQLVHLSYYLETNRLMKGDQIPVVLLKTPLSTL